MVLVKMKTDLQNIRNIGQFIEKYTKTIKSSNGDIRELNALYDPLVLARNIINNMLKLLSQEMDVAQRKNGMVMKE
jgi:hypothetical protein